LVNDNDSSASVNFSSHTATFPHTGYHVAVPQTVGSARVEKVQR